MGDKTHMVMIRDKTQHNIENYPSYVDEHIPAESNELRDLLKELHARLQELTLGDRDRTGRGVGQCHAGARAPGAR